MPPENENCDPCPCDLNELEQLCQPGLERLLSSAPSKEVAGVNVPPHVQQLGMADAVPFLANTLLTLVAKYGPGIAQQAIDLIKDELAKLGGGQSA